MLTRPLTDNFVIYSKVPLKNNEMMIISLGGFKTIKISDLLNNLAIIAHIRINMVDLEHFDIFVDNPFFE